ncbi:MAG: IPTL-CTERM sorting domain-containing protein [Ottowia sp.]|nr:MAG: IPTL-CTERM sorting domain-containing protein [Ottowia sp.]
MVNPPIQGAGAPALRDSAGSVTRFTSFSTRLRRASLRGAMALGALVFATGAWAQSADMVLSSQTVNPDPVPAGGTATITIRVDNNGPGAASNVSLTDTLPPGSTFVSMTASDGGTCNGAAPYHCDWASVPFQAFRTVTLKVTLPTAGVWPNAATVSAATPDSNANNNTLTRNITAVAAADLRITATSTAGAGAAAGTPYNYTLHVDNAGPNALPAGQAPTVTFNVPAGATINGVPTGTGWSCTPAGGYPRSNPPAPGATITCTRTPGNDTLANGAAFPDISVPAVGNLNGTVTASFGVGSSYPDGDLANNTALVNVPFTSGTDMTIGKSASPSGTVATGAAVAYTLRARQQGGTPPSNIVVTDTLPAGLTYVSHSAPAPWSCTWTAPQLSCTYGGTYNGGPYNDLPDITLNTTVNGTGSIQNTANVALPAGQTDPVPGNNSSSVTVTGSNEADLRLTKAASISPVVLGQNYNWNISVRNMGPLAAAPGQFIDVTENIPAGLTVRAAPSSAGWSCTPPPGGYPANGPLNLSCRYTVPAGGLAANANAPNLAIPVVQPAAGSISNRACVALSGPGRVDGNAGNDCQTVGNASTATSADLSITKTASPNPVVVGQNLTYVLTVNNAGPDAATDVHVRDALANLLNPGGLVSAAVTTGSGTCNPAGPANGDVTVDCTIPTLASGATAVVTIVVKPGNTGSTDLTRTNSATVHSNDVGDPNRGNNTSNTTSTTVQPRVDMTVTKSVTPNPVHVGEPLVYVVTARNNGPSTATNVKITDVLPANTAMLGTATATNGGSCTAPADGATSGTVECTWASVPPNTQSTATFRLRPLAAALNTTIHNVVNVTTDSTETNTNNNSGSADATVIAADLDVLVHKTDSVDPVVLGGDTMYTLTVTNVGPSYGTNLVVTDTFPQGSPTARFSWQGSLTASVAGTPVANVATVCTTVPAIGDISGTLKCTFPTVAPGAANKIVITYMMRAESIVTAGAYSGTQSNHVEVKVDETERESSNNATNEDTTTRRVDIATDLALAKAIDKPQIHAGDTATYTLTVTNNGPLASNGAQVMDPLPAGLSFVSSPDGCVAAGSNVSCAVGALAVNATKTFHVLVQLANPYTGNSPIINTATLDAPGDTNPGNNTGTARTEVPGAPVDPAVAASIAGTVYHDRNDNGIIDPGEEGIAGVTIELLQSGVVVATTTTDANGHYSFTGLMPGTYTVHEVQPGGWIDGKDTLGTGATGGAGTAGNDVFSDVVLQDGNHAIDYNFGEHKPDVSAIPTLSQWSLALLALLMAGFAVRRRVHG